MTSEYIEDFGHTLRFLITVHNLDLWTYKYINIKTLAVKLRLILNKQEDDENNTDN